MERDLILGYLSEFSEVLGTVLEIIPWTIDPVNIFASYIPIKFEANIVVEDAKPKEYYIYLGLNGHSARAGSSRRCNFTLSGSLKDWISVLKSDQTLVGACNLGRISMTGVRQQYILRMVLYSELIHNFNMRRDLLVLLAKALKAFPRMILRELISRAYSIAKHVPFLKLITGLKKHRGSK
jgi:hypothetical protein